MRRASSAGHAALTDEALGLGLNPVPEPEGPKEEPLGEADPRAALALESGYEGEGGARDGGSGEAAGALVPMDSGARPRK